MTLELSNSNESPKLTVIVPVYKVEKYLPKCLDSIINQTYKNLQIICVDDGSPDKCGDILEEYAKKDSRIIVIHKENGGLSSARNAALALMHKEWKIGDNSCSKFVTFVDSDDFLDIDIYSKVMSNFNDKIDLVAFGYKNVCEDGVKINDDIIKLAHSSGNCGVISITPDEIFEFNLSVWNKIYKTDIIFNNEIWFPNGVSFEDSFFTPIYLMNCKSVWSGRIIGYNYTRRRDSITGKDVYYKPGTGFEYIKCCIATVKYFQDRDILCRQGDIFWNMIWLNMKTAFSIVTSESEENELYCKALQVIDNVPHSLIDAIHNYYLNLLVKRKFKEHDVEKCFKIFKIKYRFHCLTY